MNTNVTIKKHSGELTAQQNITAAMFNRFVSYLDATPKTVETYTKALKQLAKFLSLNGIKNPQREDIIAFRDELEASGLKPTTRQNYGGKAVF